jgi:NDP-sugar pyrophosphorylase family protein
MISVNGKPFLEYEIGLLKKDGVDDLVLCVGYLGEKVRDYFGDGSKWGVRITYSDDGPNLMGPVGALKGAESLLCDHFFVTYGDTYLRVDYRNMMRALLDSGRVGLMAVYKNRNKYGKSDVVVSKGHVVRYDKKCHGSEMEWVNFGVIALRKTALALVPSGRAYTEEELYGELINRHELLAFPVQKRFYEIGNPQSLMEFERFISTRT